MLRCPFLGLIVILLRLAKLNRTQTVMNKFAENNSHFGDCMVDCKMNINYGSREGGMNDKTKSCLQNR